MPIYSRRQIAEHFRALLQHQPRQHAIQMTASHFGHAAETVEGVVKDAAVTAYLHAVGQPGHFSHSCTKPRPAPSTPKAESIKLLTESPPCFGHSRPLRDDKA